MDLQTRKLELIKQFLKIKNEHTISRLEKILKENENSSYELTEEELNERVAESESDFENGRFKPSSELLDKYK